MDNIAEVTDINAAPEVMACDGCKAALRLDEITHEDLVRPHVWETYMLCPHCGRMTHVFYMTPALRELEGKARAAREKYKAGRHERDRLRTEEIMLRFQREFLRVQERMSRIRKPQGQALATTTEEGTIVETLAQLARLSAWTKTRRRGG